MERPIHAVNIFIVNTTRFLNKFSDSCESKLLLLSSQITGLEIQLNALEVKCRSIATDDQILPIAEEDQMTSREVVEDRWSDNHNDYVDAKPHENSAIKSDPSSAEYSLSDALHKTVANDEVDYRNHPDYALYFKLLHLGVPLQVISIKMVASGLDPSIITRYQQQGEVNARFLESNEEVDGSTNGVIQQPNFGDLSGGDNLEKSHQQLQEGPSVVYREDSDQETVSSED